MTDCPFCGRDPFHYVDNGVGMEAVAVDCCELGDLFFRGARPAPEEVTLQWEEFLEIGSKLANARSQLVSAQEMVRRMTVEFEDYHYVGCPHGSFNGAACGCFAGALLTEAKASLTGEKEIKG